MLYMPTEHLKLEKGSDGYYRTFWTDDRGARKCKSFGKVRVRAQNRFARFHTEWKADTRVRNAWMEGPITIRAGWERFRQHAEAYYRGPDGAPTGEADNLAAAFRPVLGLYGDAPAAEFGPLALKAVRNSMIAAGLTRNGINARVRKIRQVFKWLAGEELIPGAVLHALQAVSALSEGRAVIVGGDEVVPTESVPVGPVPDAHVWAVCQLVPPVVRDMIKTQYFTGCRPAEVCGITPVMLETGGRVWIYRPAQHKTKHKGKPRTILFGPQAQAVITPYLTPDRNIHAPCFSPAEAQRQRADMAMASYQRPANAQGDYRTWPSYLKRKEARTGRACGSRYCPKAYARLIARVCKDNDIPHWHPNQLRHNAATRLRKEFGLDVAQVVLGHSKADITQVYAEIDLEKAIVAMERVG